MPARSTSKRAASKQWVITLTTLLMLAMFPAAWILYKRTNAVKAELAKYNEPSVETEDEDAGQVKPLLTNPFVVKESAITLPNQTNPAKIKVYWQADNIYLFIDSLSKLPVGERYEVWSIAGGKRTSLGLFDAGDNNKLIIKAEKANMTDNYDIKIVKQGSTTETAIDNN